MTEQELQSRKKVNDFLIQAATPIMLDLYNQLKSGGYLLLADTEGYLVEMLADPIAQTIADRSGMSPGARWMEENVGSTGLWIALRTRSPMATFGMNIFVEL